MQVSLFSLLRAGLRLGPWILAGAWSFQAIRTARGLERVDRLLDPGAPATPPAGASIVVVVPACNEEVAIAACITSLITQDWGDLHIIAVDDRSTDATGMILDGLAQAHPDRLSVLHVTDLPLGWLGKTHAMALAARHARSLHASRWFLFTDGDVLFHPECLRRSLAFAEAQHADHFVTLPTPMVKSIGEGVLLAFLQVMGLWGVRLWRIKDASSKDAVGVGAFVLLRRAVYEQLGGFEALRLQVLEDLALARMVKDAGLRQRVAIAPGYVRVHWAVGLNGVLNTMTKNLFAIFRFRLFSMLGACVGLTILCFGPIVGLVWSNSRMPSVVAIAAVGSLYVSARRHLADLPAINFFAFPLSAVLFLYAVGRSTVITLKDGGVRWRGTIYPLEELRGSALKLR